MNSFFQLRPAASRGRFLAAIIALVLGVACATHGAAADDAPIELKIVGGLANVSQFTAFEAPFWQQEVPRLTHGRVKADIYAFDRSGLEAQEMLQLMHLGVVPFGTALLAIVAGDEPELNAVDLPTLNPDIASLRRTVALYRGHLQEMLKKRYDIELLAVYAYPAQVVFCSQPFSELSDLSGRKVRTSSVGQSEMMTALGAIPVQIPFAGIVDAMRHNVVDCAITGTLSGGEIGLPDVTSYISPMAISWGLSFFGANRQAWDQLPSDVRDELRAGIQKLEAAIWDAADRETSVGLACDTGAAACSGGRQYHMTLVPMARQDEAERKQLLVSTILPRWIQRCGADCVTAWNETLAPVLGISAKAEASQQH